MSIMICENCGKSVDTDIDDFEFIDDSGLCIDCLVGVRPTGKDRELE